MKLTSFTDYSLRVLMFLAVQPNELYTSKEIAKHFDIPINHMIKITHNLAKTGLITTQKGKHGGIRIAKDPKAINIGQTIRQLEPNFHIAECFDSEGHTCRIVGNCKLQSIFFKAYTAFIGELDKYTLADVISNGIELREIFNN